MGRLGELDPFTATSLGLRLVINECCFRVFVYRHSTAWTPLPSFSLTSVSPPDEPTSSQQLARRKRKGGMRRHLDDSRDPQCVSSHVSGQASPGHSQAMRARVRARRQWLNSQIPLLTAADAGPKSLPRRRVSFSETRQVAPAHSSSRRRCVSRSWFWSRIQERWGASKAALMRSPIALSYADHEAHLLRLLLTAGAKAVS
ncbi:hypothetical protein EV126DRAFT_14229 [Verticillium dahliae]|nr:hypothetical protein EV126DRAFT_14229 [Verticillium dahliae]